MPRIFKISGKHVHESDLTRDKTPEEVQAILAVDYPEIANSTYTTHEDNQAGRKVTFVTYTARPGTKG